MWRLLQVLSVPAVLAAWSVLFFYLAKTQPASRPDRKDHP